ncbi:hypothetical protein [Lentzea sp. HUAS12]|uniref:hypothetical protein n=1 Tax=Lentzea sp. HUAS12 TaxID=2951806 RepID=UPI0020A0EB26|nr:hypothetical protein [Lentzea sp. HUAS12]USX56101.1 hypothetical protein ND450_18990 [Lentzea sp. HUAS12]
MTTGHQWPVPGLVLPPGRTPGSRLSVRFRTATRRGAFLITALTAATTLSGPQAKADEAPPHLANAFGLTVTSQPRWVDENRRIFVFSVSTNEVPTPPLLQGQEPGRHAIVVTLPADYDTNTRYPVQYYLRGHPDRPDSPGTSAWSRGRPRTRT